MYQTAAAIPYTKLLLEKRLLQNPESHYCAHTTSPEPAEFNRHSHTLFTDDQF